MSAKSREKKSYRPTFVLYFIGAECGGPDHKVVAYPLLPVLELSEALRVLGYRLEPGHAPKRHHVYPLITLKFVIIPVNFESMMREKYEWQRLMTTFEKVGEAVEELGTVGRRRTGQHEPHQVYICAHNTLYR